MDKRRRNKAIVIGGAVFVVSLVVGLSVWKYRSSYDPVEDCVSSFYSGDVENAMKIYESDILGNDSLVMDLADKQEEKLEDIYQQYYDGELSYTDAIDIIDPYIETPLPESIKSTADDTKSNIEKIYNCKKYLSMGDSSWRSHQWYQAVLNYQSAYDINPEYEDVADKLDRSKTKYREAVMEDIRSSLNNSQYDVALMDIEQAIEVLGEDSSLESMRDTCLENGAKTTSTTSSTSHRQTGATATTTTSGGKKQTSPHISSFQTPTTSPTSSQAERYLNEKIRHEKELHKLNQERKETADFYNKQIDEQKEDPWISMGEEEAQEKREDYAHEIAKLQLLISSLQRDTTQEAKRRLAEAEEELAQLQDEYNDWEKCIANGSAIKLLEEARDKELSEIDEKIKNENNLHVSNLSEIENPSD